MYVCVCAHQHHCDLENIQFMWIKWTKNDCFILEKIKKSCVTGVPDCSEADQVIARSLNLSWTTVLKEDDDGMQTLINSAEVSTLFD